MDLVEKTLLKKNFKSIKYYLRGIHIAIWANFIFMIVKSIIE